MTFVAGETEQEPGRCSGLVPRRSIKEEVSRDSADMAQMLRRRASYAVHEHGVLTSCFVGCVARWVRDGFDPVTSRTPPVGAVRAVAWRPVRRFRSPDAIRNPVHRKCSRGLFNGAYLPLHAMASPATSYQRLRGCLQTDELEVGRAGQIFACALVGETYSSCPVRLARVTNQMRSSEHVRGVDGSEGDLALAQLQVSVQPVKDSCVAQGSSHWFAVPVGALVGVEANNTFGAFDEVVQLLRLAGEEVLVLGVGNEQRRR